MKRITVFAFGLVCYGIFFLTLLYSIGFLGNFVVPKSIDSGREGPVGLAIAIDGALLAMFALQHSIMARPWFKQLWTRVVPVAGERSTYVLFSSVALLALFRYWEPIGGVIWNAGDGMANNVITGVYAAGLLIVLTSTFLINHLDLFGLRQVYLYFTRQPYTHLEFRTPLFYRVVRHPLYVGWLLTFWAAPVMTVAHLFFALMTTAYILVAIRFEEKDLVDAHGDKYRRYQKQVPMIVPARVSTTRQTGSGQMKMVKSLLVLAVAGACCVARADTILDTGSAVSTSIRLAGEGVGQGVTFSNDTAITGFGFEFSMPEGGWARFMIWDETNSHLLYSETDTITASATPEFRMTSDLVLFSALAGHTYYFGVTGDAELDLQFFFPVLTLTQNGLTLVEDGNSNYVGFESPEAGDSGGATLALRLVAAGDAFATPEPSTWVTFVAGTGLLMIGRYRR